MSDVLSDETNDGAIVIKAPTEHPRIKINRWRVREGFPVSNQVILLYEVVSATVDDEEKGKSAETTAPKPTDTAIHKLKAQRVGVVKKRLYKDGAIVKAEYVVCWLVVIHFVFLIVSIDPTLYWCLCFALILFAFLSCCCIIVLHYWNSRHVFIRLSLKTCAPIVVQICAKTKM